MPRFDVTIAGELNLDLILYGLPTELPPERELLANRMVLTLGSSSAIVAHNLASLGSQVGFQSLIGNDDLGQIALKSLRGGGVDVSKVRCSTDRQTGLTVILYHDSGRKILTYPGTIAELNIADLDLDYLADSRHFHLASFYLQGRLRPDVPALFKRMKAAGLTTSLDTNDDPEDRWADDLRDVLRYVDIFMPNAREACRITRTDNVESAVLQLSQLVPLVVVKLGQDGALARSGKEQSRSPALSVDVVDPVGAGDSFDAGFLHQYLKGADLAACLASGNLAAALSVTRPGGTEGFRDKPHRDRFLRDHPTLEK